MRPNLEIKAAVTEPLPIKTVTNPNGSVSVLHAITGKELFCSLPPDVENSGPVTHPNKGSIKGNRADVPELIKRAAEGSNCPMDDYTHPESPSHGPKDYLSNP